MLFYNRKRAITQYPWQYYKDSTLENTRSLQVASWKNGGTTQIYGCMCSFEVTIRLKKK